ncbi:DMT family transporter [Pontibacterium granulatum]|uniref:DMT family transporter n=1 Tax=Pontibacterium granulatum TaxID=2036029 RepID=UPI00249AF817|nr:DMT family transporter [Pontibacterium granulatum]MDI3324253.1 DMT family transporter [Pontibacterium granulatum]
MRTLFYSQDLLRGLFYGLLAALIWSGHSTATTLGLQAGLTPTDITGLRALVAGALLWHYLLKRWRLVQRLGFWRCLMMVCCVGVPFGLINSAALQFAPVSHAGVIALGLVPLFAMLLSRVIFQQALSKQAVFSVALMLVGLALFGSGAFSQGGANSWIGDLLLLTCALLWAVFGVFTTRWQVPSLLAVAITSVGSLPFVLFWLWLWPPQFFAISLGEWMFQAFYQGLLVAGVAIYAVSRAGAALGAQKAALFSALAPGGAAIAGWLVLQQPVSLFQWIGIVVVTLGMVMALGARQEVSHSETSGGLEDSNAVAK